MLLKHCSLLVNDSECINEFSLIVKCNEFINFNIANVFIYNNVDLSVHYAKFNLSNGQKSQKAVKVLKEITFEINRFFYGLDVKMQIL